MTVLATGVAGDAVAVFASTSVVQLHALLYVTTQVSDCAHPPTGGPCWPDLKPPASSLFIALPTWGGGGPRPSLSATLSGSDLMLEQAFPATSAASSQAPAYEELAAIPLSALPKAVLSVIAPPWDGPTRFGGAAIVDLREPLPSDFDLTSTIAMLTAASETASHDAESRLSLKVPQYTAIDRVGVRRWDDNSLDCPGVVASSHVPVSGYILFMTQVGVWPSRELEYHATAGQTIFCRYSH